jgi:hypothetical protein
VVRQHAQHQLLDLMDVRQSPSRPAFFSYQGEDGNGATSLGSIMLAAGVRLTCHVCRQQYERPDMAAGQTHDAYGCSLCLSTDKVAGHVLPAQV